MSEDIAEFIRARLDEDERTVYTEGDPPHGVIAWLTFEEADGEMRYTTVAHGDTPDGPWIADGREVTPSRPPLIVYDPARALREVAAKREILTAYVACASGTPEAGDWASLRLAVETLAGVYSGHPDYQEEWKP